MSGKSPNDSRSFHSILPPQTGNSGQFNTFAELFHNSSVPSTIPPIIASANSSSATREVQHSTMKEQDEYVSQLLRIPDGDIGEHVDMDAASVSSTGTSIFDGQARTSTRLAVTRSSRQDVSKEMDNFVKIYDNACLTKDKDDRDDADILRPAVAKMASAFVTMCAKHILTTSAEITTSSPKSKAT